MPTIADLCHNAGLKLAAVKLGERTNPLFVGLAPHYDPTRLTVYWHPLGMTRCSYATSDVCVLREFCEISGGQNVSAEECGAVDAAEQEFLLEWGPKPNPPCARLGWIAPNGDFYPCAYTAHEDLADSLAKLFSLRSYAGPERALEQAGWMALKGGATLGLESESRISQDARNTLRRLVEEFELAEATNPDTDWTDALTDNPEGYSLQVWCTSPGPRGESLAREMRALYDLYFADVPDAPRGTLKTPSPYRIRRPGEHPGD